MTVDAYPEAVEDRLNEIRFLGIAVSCAAEADGMSDEIRSCLIRLGMMVQEGAEHLQKRLHVHSYGNRIQ
ncbi:MAG: hypothetical protein AAF577_11705 [Pseudomonadota bacterium]